MLAGLNPFEIAGTTALILGALAVIGAGSAIFKSNQHAATITALKEYGEAMEKQNTLQSSQLSELATKLEAEKQRSNKQDEQIKDLREMVQGVRAIKELSDKIDKEFARLHASLGQVR